MNELEKESNAGSDFDELFDEGFDREAARKSLALQKTECVASYIQAEDLQSKVTPGVRLFRYIEHKFATASLFATAQQQFFLACRQQQAP